MTKAEDGMGRRNEDIERAGAEDEPLVERQSVSEKVAAGDVGAEGQPPGEITDDRPAETEPAQ